MIMLDATNKSITALTDATATTTEPNVVVSYADNTTTTFTPGSTDAVLTGATPVTIIASPAASTQRQVKYISINNTDTVSHTITVRYIDGANTRQLISIVLAPNETLIYRDRAGFAAIDSAGVVKNTAVGVSYGNYLPSVVDAANITAVLVTTSNTSYAVYLGTANKVSSSVTVRLRVTTAIATITWAEMAIFKGAINIGGNPTLSRLGYTDVSGIYNATGLYSTAVSLSTSTVIGDELWAVFGAQATTALQVRGGLADDIQSGILASLATTRPSTVASPTAWTIAGATIVVPWIKAFIV